MHFGHARQMTTCLSVPNASRKSCKGSAPKAGTTHYAGLPELRSFRSHPST